jgi:hypothetical protein
MSPFYAGKKNECSAAGPIGTKYLCRVDVAAFPVASTPSTSVAAPAKKSSATQVVSGIVAVVASIASSAL